MVMLLLPVLAEAEQWVSITVRPDNAILTVDETRLNLRDGKAELLLAAGQHSYTVESPYYETLADTFELKETERRDLLIVMQSVYSYIQVATGQADAEVFLDQQNIGKGEVLSSRISAGDHRLTVLMDTMCLYDGRVRLAVAEKKCVDIMSFAVSPFRWDPLRWLVPLSALGEDGSAEMDSTLMAEARAFAGLDSCCVNVTSTPPGGIILIDGKEYGTTPLVVCGMVANRKYLLTVKKPGYRSAHATFLAEAEKMADVQLKLKK